MSAAQATVKHADMSNELTEAVVEIAAKASGHLEAEKDIAAEIKSELEQKYGANWHVIVGRQYGSKVSHEEGHFIFFYLGNVAYQIYKFG